MTNQLIATERESTMSTDTPTRRCRRWRLDPARSTAEFRVPNFWGLVTVNGRFDRLSGWLEIGEQR